MGSVKRSKGKVYIENVRKISWDTGERKKINLLAIDSRQKVNCTKHPRGRLKLRLSAKETRF